MENVCSVKYVFHTLLNPQEGNLDSILKAGIRPLSDFPESERWQQIQAHMPGFYEQLYSQVAQPIIQKPYINSGVFLSPIDFRLFSDPIMTNKPRIKIPVERIDPEYTIITYVLNDQRVSLKFSEQNLLDTAAIWTVEMIKEWFCRDVNRMFFYVPQIAAYQPSGIKVEPADIEQ